MCANVVWDLWARTVKFVRIKFLFFKVSISFRSLPILILKKLKALPCDLNPTLCLNAGTCINDKNGGYTCGFKGQNCDIGLWKSFFLFFYSRTKFFNTLFLNKIQQQKELPCERNVDQCKNNGMCTDDNTGGSTCTCVNGYTGANCETGKNLELK